MNKEIIYKCIAVMTIGLLIGFTAGMIYGAGKAMMFCVNIGEKILNISVNPATMQLIVNRYPEIWAELNGRNNNASLLYNSWD